MGAILLSGGSKGKRYGPAELAHHDSSGQRRHFRKARPRTWRSQYAPGRLSFQERLTSILAENCGREFSQVAKDIDRDYWMTPVEGVDYWHH